VGRVALRPALSYTGLPHFVGRWAALVECSIATGQSRVYAAGSQAGPGCAAELNMLWPAPSRGQRLWG